MFNALGRQSRHNETDPRRRARTRSNRDRHSVTAMAIPSPIATALAHVGLQLRLMRERIGAR